jgi:acyl-CoA hydrolase
VRNFALVNIHEDVKMQGYITYTGSSSMEVTIDILAARPDRNDLLAETKFIMVARAGDKAGKVPGLLLANDEVTATTFIVVYLKEGCCKQLCVREYISAGRS